MERDCVKWTCNRESRKLILQASGISCSSQLLIIKLSPIYTSTCKCLYISGERTVWALKAREMRLLCNTTLSLCFKIHTLFCHGVQGGDGYRTNGNYLTYIHTVLWLHDLVTVLWSVLCACHLYHLPDLYPHSMCLPLPLKWQGTVQKVFQSHRHEITLGLFIVYNRCYKLFNCRVSRPYLSESCCCWVLVSPVLQRRDVDSDVRTWNSDDGRVLESKVHVYASHVSLIGQLCCDWGLKRRLYSPESRTRVPHFPIWGQHIER